MVAVRVFAPSPVTGEVTATEAVRLLTSAEVTTRLPTSLAPLKTFTVSPATTLAGRATASVGVVSSVTPPPAKVPTFAPASSVAEPIVGAEGAVVSTVTAKPVAVEVTPSVPLCVTLRVWAPCDSAPVVWLHLPSEPATTVPIGVREVLPS